MANGKQAGRRVREFLCIPAMVASMLLLQACNDTGTVFTISKIELGNTERLANPICDSRDPQVQPSCTPELYQSLLYAPLDKVSLINIFGVGTCSEVVVDFGDGTPRETHQNVTFRGSWQRTHTYSGWPGHKLIRVTGCGIERTRQVLVGHIPDGRATYVLGFTPNTSVCNFITSPSSPPPLRKGTVVRIETDGSKIKYGLPEFDASGDASQVTPSDYPFPGHKVFSLVYRVGTAPPVQGEAGPVVFRVAQTAPLEICVNDHARLLGDNRGKIRLEITVNESSAE